MSHSMLMPYQPDQMSPGRLAAVSYLARYSGHTHTLYASQLRRWFDWCEANALDPLVGIQRPAATWTDTASISHRRRLKPATETHPHCGTALVP